MAALPCDIPTLMNNSSCFNCLSDTELLAYKVRLLEVTRAFKATTTARSITALLSASVAWRNVPAHNLLAIDIAQTARDAVTAGALVNPTATAARQVISCYCAPQKELLAIIAMLQCQARQ
jgi:hypothetical protein